MSPAFGHVLAELGLATGDLGALCPVQSLHRTPSHWGCWFMHEPKCPGSSQPSRSPFLSPTIPQGTAAV